MLFKEAFHLIIYKEHLTLPGLHMIVAIKAAMNLGLSQSLQAAFPDVTPRVRPIAKNLAQINSEWFSGFSFFLNRRILDSVIKKRMLKVVFM